EVGLRAVVEVPDVVERDQIAVDRGVWETRDLRRPLPVVGRRDRIPVKEEGGERHGERGEEGPATPPGRDRDERHQCEEPVQQGEGVPQPPWGKVRVVKGEGARHADAEQDDCHEAPAEKARRGGHRDRGAPRWSNGIAPFTTRWRGLGPPSARGGSGGSPPSPPGSPGPSARTPRSTRTPRRPGARSRS